MKFHNIRMVGPFNNEHLTSLPTFDTSKDPGRMVWLNDGSLWYGETDRWVKILAGDGGGGAIHNDLAGRSDNDCHPISAITGLEEALRYAGMRWEIVDNSSWTVQDHVGYLVDTTNGSVTATLPAVSGMAPSAALGMVTEIVDMVGSFNSNKVTVVTPDGELIMGLNEPLEIDTEWASVTLVYSDSTHGWIVTDGKAGDCGIAPTDNIIPVDTTIYIAPSASIDGVIPVGSDVDGDGSYEKPFYSIKRAIKFLENYRIRVGVYVTIRGLPGKYQYNDDHIVEVKHKDAKYIKIKFDMYESGYYHQTTITTDTVTQDTSADDYDLITFTVNDIGTGHNQIQANDYIRILADDSIIGSNINASIWCGFYRVASVDIPNNKITIIFKRDQSGGSYNTSNHSYLLPDTISSGITVTVTKFATHVYITRPNISTNNIMYFITSNYGIGGIVISASNEEYYNGQGDTYTNTYSGKYVGGLVNIYDGVIEEISLNVNGFNTGISFDNLRANFIDYFVSTSTYGNNIYNTTLLTKGIIINNFHYGINLSSSSSLECDEIIRNVYSNGYYDSITLNNSTYSGSRGILTDKHSNFFYNRNGVWMLNGSVYRSVGTNMQYNDIGINASQSKISFFMNYSPIPPTSVISNNNNGINIAQSTFIYLDFLDILNNNGNGININSGSYAEVSGNVNRFKSNNNGSCGIYIENAFLDLDGFETKGNVYGINSKESSGEIINGDFTGTYGLYFYRGDTYFVTNCDLECTHPVKCYDTYGVTFSYCEMYNGSYGVESQRSSLYFNSCDVHDNTYGYVCRYNSNVFINQGSCINNSSRNIHVQHNSHVECYVSTEITNTNVTSNAAPTYTKTYTQGSYILQDGY